MNKMKPTREQMLAAIHKASSGLKEIGAIKAEPVPEGWRTAQQLASDDGMSLAHTNTLLKKARDMGLWECRKFRVRSGDRVYPIPHYRPIPKAK